MLAYTQVTALGPEWSFKGVGDVQEFMERTSHVLSLVSGGVGVAVSGSGKKNALEHIYFSKLAGQRVLAVLVTSGGVVRDRVLRVQRELSLLELDTAVRVVRSIGDTPVGVLSRP